MRVILTVERCQQLLPAVTSMLTNDRDTLLAGSAAVGISWLLGYSNADLATVVMVPSVSAPAEMFCLYMHWF
jgi:hypothetical protein